MYRVCHQLHCTCYILYLCTHIKEAYTLAPYKFDPINHQIKRWVAELKAIAKVLLIKFCGVFSFIRMSNYCHRMVDVAEF